MTGRTITADDPAYADLFQAIDRSWFRLEVLQAYSVPEEEHLLRGFLAGQPLPRAQGPWYDMLRTHHNARRTLRRVHVVEEPHTPYITYELAAYQDTTEAGEDVRIVPTPTDTWPDLPRHDFWILDDTQVWLMHYDHTGAFLAAEQLLDDVEIAQHQRWQDAAWQAAIPWAVYMTGVSPRQAR